VPRDDAEQAIGAFALDHEVMSATRDGFANMRVVDDKDTEVPFLVRPRNRSTQENATVDHEVVDFEVHEDGTKTVISFGAYREPVIGIRILTESKNFSRPVRVEGKPGLSRSGFKAIFMGTYSHISAGDAARDGRTVRLPSATRCSEWRVTLENHDNPAMTVTGVLLVEHVHEAVFVNTQPSSYRVFYGGDGTRRPQYDMATVLNASGDAPLAAFRLGPGQENTENGGWWPLVIGGKVVLLTAILAMVVVLAWGVASAAGKVEQA